MMQVLVISQNKGGDGKTTLSRLLGEWAGRQGIATLMIDMDPQCNLSQRFLSMDMDATDPDGVMPPVHPDFDPDGAWDGRSSIADIYTHRMTEYGVTPYATNVPNVDILPGHGSSMRAVEMVRSTDVQERVIDRLHEFLTGPEIQAMYSLAIIDTPPSKGPLVRSAIRAATHLLIPSQMEWASIDGLQGMMQLWRRENESRPADRRLAMLGILPNKFRPVVVQQGALAALQERPAIQTYLLPFMIHQRTAFAESDHPRASPRSVFDLADSSKAKHEAEVVCRHVFERLGYAPAPAALAEATT